MALGMERFMSTEASCMPSAPLSKNCARVCECVGVGARGEEVSGKLVGLSVGCEIKDCGGFGVDFAVDKYYS